MLFVLEALKEAGARTPGAMGQTMSIVGGLVLGDAAVSARFAAAPTVIVVAIAGVTGLMVPKLQTAALWLRFVLLAAAASWGLYGVGLALGLTLAALCRMHSCSVPYLLNLVPRISAEHEDTWLRYPWFFMRCDRFAVKRPSKEERP
jgi:spore germination protein KA